MQDRVLRTYISDSTLPLPPIHIFDVDRTIIQNTAGLVFLKAGFKRGMVRYSALLEIPALFFQYRRGKLSPESLNRTFPFKRMVSRKELERLGEECFDDVCLRRIFPGMEMIIRGLIARGARVILATSSFDFTVRPLARYLGISEVIASEFEYENGICTGKIKKAPVFAEEKRNRVEAYLKRKNLDGCWFYTDSIHDLPLLSAAGVPVAVNPDRSLRRTAALEGWAVMDAFRGVLSTGLNPLLS